MCFTHPRIATEPNRSAVCKEFCDKIIRAYDARLTNFSPVMATSKGMTLRVKNITEFEVIYGIVSRVYGTTAFDDVNTRVKLYITLRSAIDTLREEDTS